MKSFKKGILALSLTLGIIASVGGSAVFAARSLSTKINGNYAFADSFCYPYEGRASTTFYGNGLVTVNSVYTYVNTRTLATGTISQSSGGNNWRKASVRMVSPTNGKSVYITSSHLVYSDGQTWSVTTNHAW